MDTIFDIVTHYYPPIGGPGARRVLDWVRHLPEFGVIPRIWTPVAHRRDPFYQADLASPPGVAVHRLPILDISRFARRASNDVDQVAPNSSAVALRIREWLRIPDHRRTWVGTAARALAAARPAPRIVITTSPYPSTHLIGVRLKRRIPDLIWFADFRDSWFETARPPLPTPLHRCWNERLEREVLRAADIVNWVFPDGPSDAAARHGDWVRRKSVVIPNGVDPDAITMFRQHPPDLHAKTLRLAYVGTLWNRNWPPGALAGWSEFRAHVGRPVELHLVGRIEPEVQAEILAYQARHPDHGIVVAGLKTPAEALAALAAAHVAVVFALPEPWMVPMKIFECLAAGRPVLYFGIPTSPGARLVRDSGAERAVVSSFDAAGTVDLFKRFAAAVRAGDFSGFVPVGAPAQSDTRSRTRDLVMAIRARAPHAA